jgi:transketolase
MNLTEFDNQSIKTIQLAEQLLSLRTISNLMVIRPANASQGF